MIHLPAQQMILITGTRFILLYERCNSVNRWMKSYLCHIDGLKSLDGGQLLVACINSCMSMRRRGLYYTKHSVPLPQAFQNIDPWTLAGSPRSGGCHGDPSTSICEFLNVIISIRRRADNFVLLRPFDIHFACSLGSCTISLFQPIKF